MSVPNKSMVPAACWNMKWDSWDGRPNCHMNINKWDIFFTDSFLQITDGFLTHFGNWWDLHWLWVPKCLTIPQCRGRTGWCCFPSYRLHHLMGTLIPTLSMSNSLRDHTNWMLLQPESRWDRQPSIYPLQWKWGMIYHLHIRYRVAHLLANWGWVDFDLGCSILCLVLPGLMGKWQKWLSRWARWCNIPNQSLPYPVPGVGPPCSWLAYDCGRGEECWRRSRRCPYRRPEPSGRHLPSRTHRPLSNLSPIPLPNNKSVTFPGLFVMFDKT